MRIVILPILHYNQLMKLILIIISLLYAPHIALASKVLKVVDGDTLRMSQEFQKDIVRAIKNGSLKMPSVRIRGIDTPEKGWRGKCKKEQELGLKATNYTKKIIKNAANIKIKNLSWGKYGGRVLADVEVDGVSLAEMLIKAKLARKYDGGKKRSWCE